MKKKKARADKNYKFTGKKHSRPGAVALVFSFAPLVLFIYAVSVSYLQGGRAQETIGCIGFAAVLAALLTLRVSVREAMSVLMLAGWMTVYVIGWIGL